MRTRLILTFFALLPTLSFSQDVYEPFLEEGKVWTYHYYNDFAGKEYYKSLTVKGDTLIADNSYKRIVDVATGIFEYAMREEEKKVFCVYPHYTGEVLLYNFGLNVDDVFQLYDDDNGSDQNAWATVVSVDTVVVGSRNFRILDVRPKDIMDWPNWWVEGIGSMDYLSTNFPMVGNFYCFSSCQLNGETLLVYKDVRTVDVHNQLLMRERGNSTPLFDLQGRRVAPSSKGVYIQNGRKVVVK